MTAGSDSHLIDAWERFVAGQPPGEAVRAVVLESWQRSRRAGVDARVEQPPRQVPDLAARLAAAERLLEVAVPHLDWIDRALGDVPHAVYLVDRDGVVLAARGNDATMLERYGLRPGFDWSERARGTNGAGTALAAGEPVLIWGAEHFVRALHDAV